MTAPPVTVTKDWQGWYRIASALKRTGCYEKNPELLEDTADILDALAIPSSGLRQQAAEIRAKEPKKGELFAVKSWNRVLRRLQRRLPVNRPGV